MESVIVRTVTLGCKVNQCESADIVKALKQLNHDASEGLEPADVYILNTCSVTAEADRKSRQYLSKMRKLNPQCNIIVIGCSSQNAAERFNKSNVYAISGTQNKTAFAIEKTGEISSNFSKSIISDRVLYRKNNEYLTKNGVKTRTFIKIQDGCDRFCNYCIIPYLRGRCKSEPPQKIVDACRASKSKEIVLTGIDISAYGKDIGTNLAELLSALSEFKDVRKRIGSLECEVIDEGLLSVMANGNYCPHFHLSLQSGCDDVLKTMNRRYTASFFLEKVKLIRKYFPLAAITTDVIVGYPTETGENFDKSIEFIEACEFADIHVFPYSRRSGTLAAKKFGELPPDVVSKRVERLLELKLAAKNAFADKNIGTVAAVYTEEPFDGYNVGYTPNYLKVYSASKCGDVNNLLLTERYRDGVIGIDEPQQQ